VCDVTFGVLAHGRPGDSLSFEPALTDTSDDDEAHTPEIGRDSLSPSRRPRHRHSRPAERWYIPIPTNTQLAVIARTGNPTDWRGGRGRAALTPTICGGDGGG